MANTYTQLYAQLVFAVKDRQNLIRPQHRDELHAYMTGVIQKRDAWMMAIFCMPDHAHLFIGFKPTHYLSDLVRDVKSSSSGLIKDNGWCRNFAWQEGFGAFTYGQSQVRQVVEYVLNQEEHHRETTFRQEYFKFLKRFEVPHDPRYVFEFYDQSEEAEEPPQC